MRSLLHRLKHALGLQPGQVVSVTIGSTVWLGYRCIECGMVCHKQPAGAPPPDHVFTL